MSHLSRRPKLSNLTSILFPIIFILFSTQTLTVTSEVGLNRASIPNIVSRLGESVLLPCGQSEHDLLKQLETNEPGMPVLVNWFKHYSLKRRSDKPIYAKYLANNIDYAPHISKDYESRLQVVDKINLNITDLKATDEALYECRLILFDKAYADSQTGSMFYLQVYVAPEFEYPNEEIVYFSPNVPVRLYCYAKGKPTPAITWFKNGQKLTANTSVLQEHASLQEDTRDIFEYRCEAENLIGKIEHTVRVIRSGSLFFTQPLKNLNITEGTILNWPCLAQSNADVTYKWFKDSVSVEQSLHKWTDRGALFRDGMLYLLETYRNDSGYYECHAFTDNKRIESKAYLNILYGPEIDYFQSPYYVTQNSESIVLDCIVNSNPKINTLEWFKDKYLLTNTNKYEILSNNSLLIRNIQRADRGNYYCSCKNTIRKAVSDVISLEIVDSNKILASNLYADDYDLFKLPCMRQPTVSGNMIEWFKLNAPLPKGRFQVDSEGSLNLNRLEASDSGAYFCKLSNAKLEDADLAGVINLSMNLDDELLHSTKLIEASADEKTPLLPSCPANIEAVQTLSGIEITWSHPTSPIKIDYYQIYYRLSNTNNGWKTTESIKSNQDTYTLDASRLTTNTQEAQIFDLMLISFSIYSKSLPSKVQQFTYTPPGETSFKVFETYKSYSVEGANENNNKEHSGQGADQNPRAMSLSEIDMILVLIFLGLVLVLLLCLITCVVYRKSTKRHRKFKQNLKSDLDDWGFQSSAATATFLSSASSSEKSFNLLSKYTNKKSKHNTTADSDVTTKIVDYIHDDDSNMYTHLYSNHKIDKTSQKYSKPKKVHLNENQKEMTKQGLPKPTSDMPKNYYSPMSESTATSSIHSSGIHSCDESDESIQNVPIRKDGFLTVNTIKYNAKTNMVQQQKFSAKSLNITKKNVICEESEANEQEKADCSLLDQNKETRLNSTPKKNDYYQWVNDQTHSDLTGSDNYSPSSLTPPGASPRLDQHTSATLSSTSTSSSQNSPPFPMPKKHLLNYGSSLTMVSPRNPKLEDGSCSASSSVNGMSTSSGCSSYDAKTLKPLLKITKVRDDHKHEYFNRENVDYENLKDLEVRLDSPVLRIKNYDQFPTKRNPLGTFKTKRFDYV